MVREGLSMAEWSRFDVISHDYDTKLLCGVIRVRDGTCVGCLREVFLRGVVATPSIQFLLSSDEFEPLVVARMPYAACYMAKEYASYMLLRNPLLGEHKFAFLNQVVGPGEVFLSTHALRLLNDGIVPTFSGRGDTFIDITVVSGTIFPVSQAALPLPGEFIRLPHTFPDPDGWTPSALTEAMISINVAMRAALDTVVPLKTVKVSRSYKWWTADLKAEKCQVNKRYKQAVRQDTEDAWTLYRNLQQTYWKSMLTARRAGQVAMVSFITQPWQQAQLHRSLKPRSSISLGTVRLPDGTLTDNAQETLQHLLQEHFPASILPPPPIAHSLLPLVNAMDLPWINMHRLQQAFQHLQNRKRPGPDEISRNPETPPRCCVPPAAQHI
jgi:hypothetical protein